MQIPFSNGGRSASGRSSLSAFLFLAITLFAGATNVFGALTLNFSSSTLNIAVGGQQALFAVLSDQAPAGGVTIALTSTVPGVAHVPATMTIPATSNGIGFYVTGLSAGTTTITGITSNFQMIVATVIVGPPGPTTLSFSAPGVTVPQGSQQALFAVLSAPAPAGGLTVALSSTSPANAGVPASVIIPGGSTSVGFFVTGVLAGSAMITGNATGFAPITANVTVTPPVAANMLIFSKATLTVATGSRQVLYVNLPPLAQAPAGGLTINLSSSFPGIAQVPATITIPATSNGIGFYVTGLAPGSSTITASALPTYGPITAAVTVN